MFKRLNKIKGFTLIEVLLVVAIIAILAGIVILAVNPAKQLADTRNASRRSDVSTILNALYQYSIDNNGNLPATVSALGVGAATEVCKDGVVGAACTTAGGVDLAVLTTNGTYLVKIPVDPSNDNANLTGYSVTRDANNRLTVTAVDTENITPDISVTR